MAEHGARPAARGCGVRRQPDARDARCARAGVTTGEWARALREAFGEYRAPTGVARRGPGVGRAAARGWRAVREAVRRPARSSASRLRLLVGKPGLDGHSNGAEQVAVRARDAGFEVVYQGIRLTPEQIVAAAVAEDVHCVGLSILSGSHMELVPEVLDGLRDAGRATSRSSSAGSSRPPTPPRSSELGVAAVFTPKDFGLNDTLHEVVHQIRLAHHLP